MMDFCIYAQIGAEVEAEVGVYFGNDPIFRNAIGKIINATYQF